MATPFSSSRIVISNVHEHETLPHPLVVFDGHIADFPSLALPPHDWFLDARLDASRGAFWPVTASGRFKALVLLPAPGKYAITLRLGVHCTRVFHIEYQPPVSRYVVRFYYQKCSDARDDEGFDAPPGADNSDQSALDKIRFNALLLQTAAAEMFVHAGLPRKSFAVEFAQDGLPIVHLLRSTFPNAEARRIHDQKLIKLVEKDIVAMGFNDHDELQYKHAVILGCSKYNPVTQHSDGHTALGGGKVGIFGSCGLHTWPRHLGELTACSLNNTRVDTNLLMDDSAYRGTFWANFSTGIGAFIHELGHTFGLGHSTSGIMSRGFDDMNRLFCAYQADHKRHEPAYFQDFYDGRLQLNHQVLKEVTGPDGAHWNSGSALQLVHCEWISSRPKLSKSGPLVCWNSKVRGPVGGGQAAGEKTTFNTAQTTGDLGAVKITVSQFLDKISSYTRAELAELPDESVRSHENTHWVVLAAGECITHVEVRAMAWIDGLRIHTNLQSTRWFGGHGGQLHVLRPDDGSKINGFFGTCGDCVDTLGVHCSAITEQPLESPTQDYHGSDLGVQISHTIGGGRAHGPHQPFDFPDSLPGAIIIEGDEYVQSIRVVSAGAHEPATTEVDFPYYESNELVFALLPGELLLRVTVRSGHWIDAIQFHTNLRSSPWFGGKGGIRTEELACGPGRRVAGFFGRQGSGCVDTLGIYTTDANAPTPVRVGPVGFGEQNGVQRPFSTVAGGDLGADLGAVLVEAEEFVTSVWTYTRLEMARMRAEDLVSNRGRFWFVLGPQEFITHVEVRAMCWMDAVRLHTNERTSPWYGGTGGQVSLLQPKPGFKISGFFGTIGDNYVGRLGAYCSPIDGFVGIQEATANSVNVPVGAQPIALLDGMPASVSPAHHSAARGVLVAVQQGVVMFVSTFDTMDLKARLLSDLQAFVYAGAQLQCFSFQPGELLVQIDASVNPQSRTVEGLCFHTTTRCSSWFGSYTDSQIHFFVAPAGNVVLSVCGVPGASYLQDVVCYFTLRATATEAAAISVPVHHTANVVEDQGAYDVRVQSQSSFGLESAFLLKQIEHEDLDQHGWQWKSSPSAAAPSVWCLPQRLLEHHIAGAAAKAGKSPTELLFTKYAVGAIDNGGAYSMASCPPPQ